MLALGYSKNDIVNEFYDKEVYTYDKKINKWKTKFNPENYKSKNFSEEIVDAKNGKVIVKLGEKINFLNAKKLYDNGLKEIFVSNESLYNKYLQNCNVPHENFQRKSIHLHQHQLLVQKFYRL